MCYHQSGYRRYFYHQCNVQTTGGVLRAAARPWLIICPSRHTLWYSSNWNDLDSIRKSCDVLKNESCITKFSKYLECWIGRAVFVCLPPFLFVHDFFDYTILYIIKTCGEGLYIITHYKNLQGEAMRWSTRWELGSRSKNARPEEIIKKSNSHNDPNSQINTLSSSDQNSQLDKFSWSDQKSQQDIFSSVDQNDQVVKFPSNYIVVLKIIIAW